MLRTICVTDKCHEASFGAIDASQRIREGMIETNDASLSPKEASSSPNEASFGDNVGQRLICFVDRLISEASIGPSMP
jgi:hypothetical protein